MDGIVSETINELNTRITPRTLPVTAYNVDYCEAVSATAIYTSSIVIISVAIAVDQDVPAWTRFPVAKISEGTFTGTTAIAAAPGDNASAFLIQVDVDGTIYFNTHGTVVKKSWFYGALTAACIL